MEPKTTQYFRIFFETSHTILSSWDLHDILKLLVKRTVQALGVKAGSLLLVNDETHRLELVASHLLSRRYLAKGPLSADRSIPEVLEGRTVVVKNAFDDPRIQYRAEKRQEGINTVLSVPVAAKGKVIGVLRLYTKEPRDFSPEELEFVSALAEIGGLAIANARIYEQEGVKLSSLLKEVGVDLPRETRKAKKRFKAFGFKPIDPSKSLEYFRALHQVTTAILSTLDSREVVDLIIDKVREMMGVEGCCLRLLREPTGELELVAAKGLSERYLKKGPLHADRSIREALEGEPVLIADAASDPRIEYPAAIAEEGIRSLLSVPIIARERVIGALRLYSRKPRQYSEEEVAFLSALAEIAGIAIMNAKLYERTRYDLSFWKATLDYLQAGRTGDRAAGDQPPA